MGGIEGRKAHVVLIPYPVQGHITPFLKLAKLLHFHHFHITFVNTEFNHNRLVQSQGPDSFADQDGFHFRTIPDGLPPADDPNATQDISALCESTAKNCLVPFRDLLGKLNHDGPRVSCIISDVVMGFTLDAAQELDIPDFLFWTASACGFMAYFHYQQLAERGLFPLKDESDLTNGYLDTPVDWIPGMKKMRLRDFPSFIRTTDPDDVMFNFCSRQFQRAPEVSAIIINTFHDLEYQVLDAMASVLPPIYTVGPLSLLSRHLASLNTSLWKEDAACLDWLEKREPRSVVYVNFGSIAVMTEEQVIEFACGLASSKKAFLWVMRPDLVRGDRTAVVTQEFLRETEGRGLVASWCPQEEVLSHRAVGGFLTHSGWNSTIESICGGVPMICWPFFAEQPTNCRYVCSEWGMGMELEGHKVKREEVEGLVRELMDGEKGKAMRRRALEWKGSAVHASQPGGTSFMNLERVIHKVLTQGK